MGPARAVSTALRRSLDFRGRSGRAEFWWFTGAAIGVGAIAPALDIALLGKDLFEPTYSVWPFSNLLGLAVTLPSAAVGVRRLHDVGSPGWPWIGAGMGSVVWMAADWGQPVDAPLTWLEWSFFGLVAVLLALALLPSRQAGARYGPPAG